VVSCSASPLELAACEDEAAIVCNNGHIKGQQGVALDDMVYVMTRMARQMEEVGGAVLGAACSWYPCQQQRIGSCTGQPALRQG
jgi:hypothetical protein